MHRRGHALCSDRARSRTVTLSTPGVERSSRVAHRPAVRDWAQPIIWQYGRARILSEELSQSQGQTKRGATQTACNRESEPVDVVSSPHEDEMSRPAGCPLWVRSGPQPSASEMSALVPRADMRRTGGPADSPGSSRRASAFPCFSDKLNKPNPNHERYDAP